jgi:hypothetical protein
MSNVGIEYTEEIGNPDEGFYQKKVVREGPGFVEITVISSGGSGGDNASNLGNIMSGIFGQDDPKNSVVNGGAPPDIGGIFEMFAAMN